MKKNQLGGLSPNKQNKYSIRKYTVGTASLLIGSTLIFGVHAKDASAAEEVAKQTLSAEENKEESVDQSKELKDEDIPQVNGQNIDDAEESVVKDFPEEENVGEEASKEADQPKQDEKTAEKQQSEDKAASEKKVTPTQKSTEEEKATTVDQNKEQQAPTPERKTTEAASDVAPKVVTNSTETQAPVDTEKAALATQANGLADTVKQVASLTSNEEKEAKLVDYYSKNAGVNSETAKQVVKGMNLDYQNLDSDQLTAEMLIALANKQEKNAPKATPASLKPRSAMMRSASFADVQPAALTSKNVNDLVRFSDVKVDKNKIDPNLSGSFRITAHYDVTGPVKEGDYFTVTLDDNTSLDGDINYDRVNYEQKVDLLTPSGFVMAEGVYDTRTKVITYTFTDWVNNKTNIKGDISLAQFTDRKNSPISKIYSLDYDFAGKVYNTTMNIDYSSPIRGNGPASVTSMITDVDQISDTHDYKQVIYVNPTENKLQSAYLTLYPYTDNPAKSSAIVNLESTQLHIYQVNSANELTESYYFNPEGHKDLAQGFYNKGSIYKDRNGNLQINFGAIQTPYVVLVDSPYNPKSKEDIKVRSTLEVLSTTGVRSSFYWDNTLVVEKNSGTGVGTDAVYRLGDYVWVDANKNGIQDFGEKPLKDVTVILRNTDGTELKRTKTDEYGNYLFNNLQNGDYVVEFQPLPGYSFTQANAENNTTDLTDSDAEFDANTKAWRAKATIMDKDNMSIDAGLIMDTYEIGDKVWEDSNKDGIQQDTESGISGVKVTLKDKDGKVVETKTTDEKGNYLFKNVAKGDYTIEFETPQGYTPTVTGKGELDKDSNGTSAEITVTQDDLTIDSGFYQPTYNLGDRVWEDTNKNGIQEEDEKGIHGVKVTLKDSKGAVLRTTRTNTKGDYIFTDLVNGEYRVDFETPAGYEPTVANKEDDTKDADGPLNAEAIIKDKDNLTVDQGFYKKEEPKYHVGDKVWEDSNKDGIQQDIEPGISGVKVTLKDKDGKVVETKTTDEKGNYLFENVAKGEYTVEFETPQGYKPTEIGKGDADKDSNGTSAKITVTQNDLTIDSGFYKPTYSLGDRVWEDTNKNGIQDEDEKGIKGVKVTLKDSTGEELDTTVTNDKGEYEFKDLPNGEYQVDFETPEGYVPTVANTEDDTKDSDGPLNAKGVIKDEDNLTVDQGFYKKEEPPVQKPATYKVGDKVWHDTNKDGIQNVNEPGISGVTVTLKQPDGTLITTKTDKEGNYIFKDLPNGKYEISFETPEGYEATTEKAGDDRRLDSDGKTVTVEVNNADDLTIDSGFYKPVVEPPKTDATYKVGDKVWNDTNKDGIQNANEAGIEGVKVTLTKADGTTVETRTDKDGNYIFTDLPNGKYEISFETPEGYEATTANVGDDALDSDGTKVEVEVNNADDLTIDSGFYKPVVEPPKTDATYKVGDKVWNDTNKDGIQNANEAGIEGVKVTLTKADGTTVETRTDKDGNYIFTDLPNGKYEISFETPEGYEATTANVGDDALDSDGTKVEVEVNNADDLTIDSGFYKPTPEVPTPEVPEQPGNPEVPTPEVPEQPGNPEVPAPEVPEQPGNPEVPTPEVPEQPGNPEVPAPEVPEQPGNPEVPTPEVPEQPGNPEVPTPEVPEQPGNPEVPTPEVPEQPGNPETPAPNMPEQPGQPKVEKAMPSTPQKAESKHKKETLPETGQENAGQTTLLGSLFAALGGAFLLGRRRKDKKEQ
ncbi:SdrD B-like domain-containing protein [Staphylococcus coagulans]|uniref:SdrD B-like domain-containing protein n=1 Tax=Staphylococcus coagulans TaxID=74706 RepID=UPI0015FD86C8|nr:SdrD B-like domain-containing protein [Staphylococcus coagulans]MBA8774947.1 YSIRK-type signal peptide-containing protein [Staphylococcus coagulans]